MNKIRRTVSRMVCYSGLLAVALIAGVSWAGEDAAVKPQVVTAKAAATLHVMVCCKEDNDLLRTLASSGYRCERMASPVDAVNKAADGGSVMILADNYPEQTTVFEPAVFESAARKKLRLYVEYPSALPGVKTDAPKAAGVERAVVSSDMFGPKLAKLRILAINGLHFVPVQAEGAHIVAAKVAGFDTAVFGLPKSTTPVLFECGGGQVLVATTKLSNFITGRYAPKDAWQALWAGVMGWMFPGKSVPEVNWTPSVSASYGLDDALPADFERQAFKRGVEWFKKSKLLLDSNRVASAAEAMNHTSSYSDLGLMTTPVPDSPIGDGSLGIMEAPLSIVRQDGSQMLGVARRGDCQAESAMALAFGGKLCGDGSYSAISKNLLDFYLFNSDARKKERGDPANGAYGLSAWGIDSKAWYTANYGDDNARLLLGTAAAAALTGETRWDEPMMMCLLANLRTAGKYGFRDDRIDIPELTSKGWKHFFEREIVSYSPHMECYLWACYLWAYKQTGYDLFLHKAKTAIRMTMEKHTDGWRWTNGLSQERARMLLPLAWLVRVEPTDENKAMLHKVAEGLLQLQQPCGAIREELGLSGHGMFPPPQSNEAYGSTEASLIQTNGDSVCDMLYTVNFAFLGLHEAAAATGEKYYSDAEKKLAEFLCRIQVRSKVHPALDGGWFRAFDFGRWEAWGSNADAGWGAWAIESGWTQGWIVSVLGMRQMKTSLWDLVTGVGIDKSFDKLRKEMLP